MCACATLPSLHPNDVCILASLYQCLAAALLFFRFKWCGVSGYFERILRVRPHFFQVPLTCHSAFSFSQVWEQTVTHKYSSCVALRMIGGCSSLSSLLQALPAALGHTEVCSQTDMKVDLGGFLLLHSQMSYSPYHWVVKQIPLWKPLETGADSTTALLSDLGIRSIYSSKV